MAQAQKYAPFQIKTVWESKCWGKVHHIFSTPQCAVSHLMVTKGFRCSRHKHVHRANMFCVQSGLLRVRTWDWAEMATRDYDLKAGDTLVVPSGLKHEFHVIENGRVIEVYWPDRGGECKFDDIVRDDIGGRL